MLDRAMRHTDLHEMHCSVARTWTVLGERWTMLVVREAFNRTRRFEDFQDRLGIARNVLADRLARLVDEGILERRLYQEHPSRYEYRLTDKGLDLYPVLVAIMRWGDRYKSEAAPVRLVHESCGHEADPKLVCSHCGEELRARDVRAEPGPGLAAAA
jgi:DNA-binding HxlR family transcriptional regulator